MIDLSENVLLRQHLNLFLVRQMRVMFFNDHSSPVGVGQPCRHAGHVAEMIRPKNGRHRTAMRMAAHDDVLYPQTDNGVFDRLSTVLNLDKVHQRTFSKCLRIKRKKLRRRRGPRRARLSPRPGDDRNFAVETAETAQKPL